MSKVTQDKKLQIRTFGSVSFKYENKAIGFSSRKAQALILYLALAPGNTVHREHTLGLLWGDSEEQKARASLRQVVRTLRRIFDTVGFKGFHADRLDLYFDPDAISIDVNEMLHALEEGVVHNSLLESERISDKFLIGFEDVDPSFRSWLFIQREHICQHLIRSLEIALENSVSNGGESKKLLAEALNLLDPTHETACRHLIRCYADTGDTAGALNTYNKLWELLGDNYDMEPSSQTQELIVSIKGGTYAAQLPVKTEDEKDRKKNASLSFDNTSEQKLILLLKAFDLSAVSEEKRYLAVGFRYELLSRLARFREWALVDGETAGKSISENFEHNPSYEVVGRLFELDGELIAMVTIQQTKTGLVVWSERFDLSAEAIFDSQREIIHRIAVALNLQVSIERIERAAPTPDMSLEIFDRWLRAQSLGYKWDPLERKRVRDILLSILNDAPKFAPAHSALAQLENSDHIIFPGRFRGDMVDNDALFHATRAVAIDPLDSRAHLCHAWANAYENNFDQAEVSFRHAALLNPDDPWTVISSAWGLANCGHTKEAENLSIRSIELSPYPTAIQWCYRLQVAFACEDYEAVVSLAEKAGESFFVTSAWRAAALAHLGRVEEANEAANQFLQTVKSNWFGDKKPTKDSVIRWFLQLFPFSTNSVPGRILSGLSVAGMEVDRMCAENQIHSDMV